MSAEQPAISAVRVSFCGSVWYSVRKPALFVLCIPTLCAITCVSLFCVPLSSHVVAKTPGIYISKFSRSKHKFITAVKGMDGVGIVLKDVCKLLSKKFACSASVVKTGEGQEINVQGDLLMDMPQFIVDNFPVTQAANYVLLCFVVECLATAPLCVC